MFKTHTKGPYLMLVQLLPEGNANWHTSAYAMPYAKAYVLPSCQLMLMHFLSLMIPYRTLVHNSIYAMGLLQNLCNPIPALRMVYRPSGGAISSSLVRWSRGKMPLPHGIVGSVRGGTSASGGHPKITTTSPGPPSQGSQLLTYCEPKM